MGRTAKGGVGWRALVATLGASAAMLGAVAPARAQAPPVQLSPVLVDGPAAPGAEPSALTGAFARDGSGALVYVKPAGGTGRLYVAALFGGTFAPAVQVTGLAAAAPVVAAGPGGALVIAFLSGSNLYATTRARAGTPFSAPRLIASGAASPALAMSAYGKAYLAYTVHDGTGADVRVAFADAGRWTLVSAPLNLSAGDDAGSGAGRPAVAAAGDGVGVLAWGEGGHVYARRVWAASPSVVTERVDAPPPGCGELAADQPAVGTGGDSSYVSVAFRATLSCGGQTVSRVLANRVRGSRLDGVWAADGPGPGDAQQPAVAVGEYGTGWITAEHAAGGAITAEQLYDAGAPGPTAQVNSLPNASPPLVVPAMAGLYSTVIAWQHDPGGGLASEIRARYAWAFESPEPEVVLSSPAQGPTDAAAGLAAGGDIAGDAVVAWVQSAPAGAELMAARLVAPPLAPLPALTPGFVTARTVTLSWAPATEPWGPVTYALTIDGVPVAQTAADAVTVATPAQGPHTWAVNAVNGWGLSSGPQSQTLFVDTIAPRLTARLTGRRVAGRPLTLTISASDVPTGLPASAASGLASITVHWGDGTVQVIGRRHPHAHVYARAGRYRLTVVATDRAGNASRVVIALRVAPRKPRSAPPRKRRP